MSKRQRTRTRHLLLVAVASLLVVHGSASALLAQDDDEKMRQEYTAFGVAMGPGVTGVLEIVITRWSTADERKMLVESLVEKGQEETIKLLRKQEETGFLRTRGGRSIAGFPSVRLHYAYEFHKEDGTREIVIVTDRPIGMREAMSMNRSNEYDLSALEMVMEKKGDKEEGSGTLLAAVKIGYDKEKKHLEVEALGQQPIRLTDIKRDK